MSSGGCDINMDGTRYCLLHEASDEGQEQTKLNFSMIAIRLSKVSLSPNKGAQTRSKVFPPGFHHSQAYPKMFQISSLLGYKA